MNAGHTSKNGLRYGGNLVRLAYLDEAGVSDLKNEPIYVVAGVCVHGDNQWKPLEDKIQSLIDHFIPEESRDEFVFHATELFSGGKFFDRENWSRTRRNEILEALCAIPKEFNLPVFIGYTNRIIYRNAINDVNYTPLEFQQAEHGMCLAFCEIGIEQWLKQNAPDENAMLIAEDTDRIKPHLKALHKFLKDGKRIKLNDYFNYYPELPLTKIIDTVHFAAKNESKPLQLADLYAFFVKRELQLKQDSKPFFRALESQIVYWGTSQWT